MTVFFVSLAYKFIDFSGFQGYQHFSKTPKGGCHPLCLVTGFGIVLLSIWEILGGRISWIFQGFYCNAEELFKTAKESRYLGPICAYQWRINVPKKKMKCSPFVLTN